METHGLVTGTVGGRWNWEGAWTSPLKTWAQGILGLFTSVHRRLHRVQQRPLYRQKQAQKEAEITPQGAGAGEAHS